MLTDFTPNWALFSVIVISHGIGMKSGSNWISRPRIFMLTDFTPNWALFSIFVILFDRGIKFGSNFKQLQMTNVAVSGVLFLWPMYRSCACIPAVYGPQSSTYTGACNAPVFCFSLVLILLSFFCQPHNLMYLQTPLTDFNETLLQWSMTKPAYVIWPLTGSNVIQGHRGQKWLFSLKSLLLLQIT